MLYLLKILLVIAALSRICLCTVPYNVTTAIVLCNMTTSIPKLRSLTVPWSCPNASSIHLYTWCKWTGVVCNTRKQITSLTLMRNSLAGSLPSSLGQLTSLNRYLWIYDNQISGTIPSSLSSLTKLLSLRLDDNMLSGSAPSSLSHLTKLETLNLNNNYLTGTLPSHTSATYNDDGQGSLSTFNQLTHYPTSQPTGQPSRQPTSQPSTTKQFISTLFTRLILIRSPI